MKALGFLFLFAGWIIAFCAVALLGSPAARNMFVLAGIGLQAAGLFFAVRAHIAVRNRYE